MKAVNGWSKGIQNAIEYMEENITDRLEINDIASKAYVSAFHFQRIFSILCGYTVAEYIRNRRLTLAGQKLAVSNERIIDIALEFGYDSPDSFTRAFTRFHGISPSAAKEKGAKLKSFAPLRIKLTLEGGTMLEYKIVSKAAFTVMGKLRNFSFNNSYKEIPEFWDEHMKSEDSKIVCGMYGICYDGNENGFEYLIADNYIPWNEIPDGYITKTIPEGMWAIFPCRGALPQALQEVNTKIWNEWLPNCKEYKLAGNYNIEMYTPLCEDENNNYSEIWIPIEKI